jgi:hypothetical protein
MLAICSDLDETPDRHVYWGIMQFLNTTRITAMGPGVGLEVGNSIYFEMPPDQFAYWNTDDAGRQMVRALIQSGHIDCLHSYGDLAVTRAHVGRALEELARHECRLEVWVDHGTAATNFDPLIMHGHGDEPGHEAYHADLTTEYGIQYIWRGRVTSITGQDVPPRSQGMFRWNHPVASGRTLLKEIAKQRLAQAGSAKYAMHKSNETLRPTTLRDGRPVYEFMRCNPYWGGVSAGDQGRHVGRVLTADVLNRLVERGGACVLYTHLGKIDDARTPFNSEAVQAFRRLAEESHAGRILVTTTRRLLGYRRAAREIGFDVNSRGKSFSIDVRPQSAAGTNAGSSGNDLNGLTFYVPDPGITRVTINGQEARKIRRNPPDHTGQRSVSLPWPMLEFPEI